MKIFSSNLRFSYGILLVLLIATAIGSFFTFHNRLAAAQAKSPLLAVVLILVAIIIAILLFQQLTSSINKLNKKSNELEQLRRAIQDSRKNEAEEEAKAKHAPTTVQVDAKKEAQNLIPNIDFESEEEFLEKLLSNIAKQNDVVQAIIFMKREDSMLFEMAASYAFFSENEPPKFKEGETLPGQVAKNKVLLNLNEVPQDYITVVSGLGKGTPSNLLIIPVVNQNNESIGVLELASFTVFNADKVKILEALGSLISETITIIGTRTEE